MDSAVAGDGILPDWTELPEEILVSLMGELQIPDLVRSGAVCASWQSAYAAFRRLRLPSPRQPPCLLYSCDAFGRDAAALYCPSTGATFRVPVPEPLPIRCLSPIGSAHGWLVVADEVSNLHLLNPLTGVRVALPPITTLHNVEDDVSLDEEGNSVYNLHEKPGNDDDPAVPIPVGKARDCMYDRAALSCSPSMGRDCVILLLHLPHYELSFARPGDKQWTWISPGERTGLRQSKLYRDVAYNNKDGLFYVVNADDSIYTLDLKGPSPVAKRIMPALRHGDQPDRYLIHTPWGDLLQAWRFRCEYHPPTQVGSEAEDEPSSQIESETEEDDDLFAEVEDEPSSQTESETEEDDDLFADTLVELRTEKVELYKVNIHEKKLVQLDGVGDHALFLGYNGSLCLPVANFPGLKPNTAYIMDDSTEFMNFFKRNQRDIGLWDIEHQSFQSLGDASSSLLKEPCGVYEVARCNGHLQTDSKFTQAITCSKHLHKLQAHDGYILKCLLSPKVCNPSRYLATASPDHTVKIWNVDGTNFCWSSVLGLGLCSRLKALI
ncbi:hypothetical protein EJB05_27642, partial [Eragrostis curvula]